MTVTIVKPKVVDVTKIDSESIVVAEVVDGYGAMFTKYKAAEKRIAPLGTKVAELAKDIISFVDDVIDPGTPMVLNGTYYRITLGAQGVKSISKDSEAVIDELGMELFLKLAKVSATDLKAYCTPEQLDRITTKTFAIKRRIKVEAI